MEVHYNQTRKYISRTKSMGLVHLLHISINPTPPSSSPPVPLLNLADAIHPSLLWSSFPSLPGHIQHSLTHIFFFSSHYMHYMSVPPKPTFLHFLGYFSHFCYPSNSVQLCGCTHTYQHPNFRPIQLLLHFLNCP